MSLLKTPCARPAAPGVGRAQEPLAVSLDWAPGQRPKGAVRKTLMFWEDWLEAGEEQLTKTLPSKDLVKIGQAGRVGLPLNKSGSCWWGVGGISDTLGSKL